MSYLAKRPICLAMISLRLVKKSLFDFSFSSSLEWYRSASFQKNPCVIFSPLRPWFMFYPFLHSFKFSVWCTVAKRETPDIVPALDKRLKNGWTSSITNTNMHTNNQLNRPRRCTFDSSSKFSATVNLDLLAIDGGDSADCYLNMTLKAIMYLLCIQRF